MSKIYYKKMSLFDAPRGSVLVHACNAQGVWGSGIALQFKKLFPLSYIQYNERCNLQPPDGLIGRKFICKEENGYKVGCLFTSDNFGYEIDSEENILKNTRNALDDLVYKNMPSMFYSNKFNSGLFNVPWKKTEKLVQEFIDKYNLDWTVCDPNLEKEEK